MLYEQESLDGLAVDAKGTTLDFIVHQYPDTATAGLGREEVLRLHAALGEWLYPVHTPEGPNRSLIEQMIERNVREQITAILPLHLKPLQRCKRCGVASGKVQDGCAGDNRACTFIGLGDPGYDMLADPKPAEPSDVYRPEPDAQQCRGEYGCDALGVHAAYGSSCGRSEPHGVSPADCLAPGCDREHTAGPHGRLMAELPKRAPSCIECLHGWSEHTGGICWGEHAGNSCTCTRERPEAEALRKQAQEQAAPPPCAECLHGYTKHARTGCLSMIGGSRGVECTCPRYRSTRWVRVLTAYSGGICWGKPPPGAEGLDTLGCFCTRERP